jgi:outer membrane lipoprotein-sorting protein
VVNRQYVIYRPRLKQAITGSVDKAKGSGKANNALAFLNMSREQLKASYDVALLREETVSSGVRTWHLQLTPKTKTNYKLADLWVDSSGFPVQSKVTENNNDTTIVLLTNIQKNVTVDQSSFKVQLPKDAAIVKS